MTISVQWFKSNCNQVAIGCTLTWYVCYTCNKTGDCVNTMVAQQDWSWHDWQQTNSQWLCKHILQCCMHAHSKEIMKLDYVVTKKLLKKKLEVNLIQNGLPQLQDWYHLPLQQQCRVRVFVYSKFQYGMNIKACKYSVNSEWIVFKVHPIIHEYNESTPPFGTQMQSLNEFHFATQFIVC